MTSAQLIAIAAVLLPALAVVLWPVLRRGPGEVDQPGISPADRRLELLDERTTVYRSLRELAFDHEAEHLSDEDYAALRGRYENQAAAILSALDALEPAIADRPPSASTPGIERPIKRGFARHPAVLAGSAAALLVFGVLIGLNAARFTGPSDGAPPAMSGGPGAPATASPMPPVAGVEPGKPIPPEIMAGMLRAARQSLEAGRYAEAIAAYQAVLKRDPKNVDAMTHLGLIVALGGHADAALEAFDKALAIEPTYAPAHLYRGQVLYEVKRDTPGAIAAWERFLALVPQGQDHDLVAARVSEARAKTPAR
jgi:tetratricopeptide (TPR) repeat protein